jgi:sugar lactone lactonase YvrE
MGLSVDSDGNIYLSNIRSSEVRVFRYDGQILNSFGNKGTREGQFRSPAGLWVEHSRLFVADTEDRRIAVFEIRSKLRTKQELALAGAP